MEVNNKVVEYLINKLHEDLEIKIHELAEVNEELEKLKKEIAMKEVETQKLEKELLKSTIESVGSEVRRGRPKKEV